MLITLNIDIQDNINITQAEEQIRVLDLEKTALEKYLTQTQEELCKPLAGVKNQRKQDHTHFYLSDKTKQVKSEFGKFKLKLFRIKDKEKQKKGFSPLLSILERNPNEITKLDKECLVLAKNTSYGKSKEILDYTKPAIQLSKTKIHEKANKVGEVVKIKHKEKIKDEKYEVISSDGTYMHSLTDKKHEVKVTIGFKAGSVKPQLIDVAINVDWATVNSRIKHHITPKTMLLSDGEKGISLNLDHEQNGFQMCNRHFLDGLYNRFWQDGVGKKEAKPKVAEFESIVFKMKSQVKKYEEDESYDLMSKMEENLRQLTYFANMLFESGFKQTYKFVKACKNNIFTYVRKALCGISLKYMSNDIERTMLEVSRRAKKKGMHWSKRGAENLLYSTLLSYFDKELFYQILDSIVEVEK